MENLQDTKRALAERIPKEGMSPVIKTLKTLVPATSPKYTLLLQLEAELRDIKIKGIEGLLSHDDLTLANNQLRRRLFDFLESLEAADFDPNAKPAPEAEGRKRGHVLYRIPHLMQLQHEARCVVRIALDKMMLLEDMDLDEQVKIRTEVVVSDFMKVEMVDPALPAVFTIRSTSEPVQFIGADDYTEWLFYVKPLQPGEHILQLKVVVMAKIDNEYYKREKVLEESVVIVADAVQEDSAAPLKTLETFDLEGNEVAPSPPRQITTSPTAPSPLIAPSPQVSPSLPPTLSPSNRRVGKALRPVAMALAALMAFTSISWAIAPQEVEWLAATLVNTPRQYEKYIEKHPKSRHREKATWEIAELTRTPRAYVTYLERYPDGTRALQAKTELQQLETSDWKRVDTTTNLRLIEKYIETYPSGRFIEKAREKKEAIQERREMRKDTTNATDSLAIENNSSKDTKFTRIKKHKDITHNEKPSRPNYPLGDMILVEGGAFIMGDEFGEGSFDERPTHEVILTDYYMGRFEVTFEEFDYYCNITGAKRPDDEGWGRSVRPVINISWYDAVKYCNWLSKQHDLNPVYTVRGDEVIADWQAKGYRLPTEAEWEYAARSRGKKEKWAGATSKNELANYANYNGKQVGFENKTIPVGTLKANTLGLYDMNGNVFEWCWDAPEKYPSTSQNNPHWSGKTVLRAIRGGAWISKPQHLRCADRYSFWPNKQNNTIGFRLARTP